MSETTAAAPEIVEEAPEAVKPVAKIDDHSFARKHPEVWKFVKFALSAAASSLPDFVSYFGCLYLFRALNVTVLPNFILFDKLLEQKGDGAPGVYAFLISTAVGYTCAFILNRKATFHANSNIALSTFLYVLMVIFTIFMGTLLVFPASAMLVAKMAFLPDFLAQLLMKLIPMLSATLWTYPAQRFIIQRRK